MLLAATPRPAVQEQVLAALVERRRQVVGRQIAERTSLGGPLLGCVRCLDDIPAEIQFRPAYLTILQKRDILITLPRREHAVSIANYVWSLTWPHSMTSYSPT